VRDQRDNATVEQALRCLKEAASGTANTVPPILECVEAYATVGEIADVFRGVFGEQRETAGF
jgi:methylmalonyl-CoA mutase N-terminal domain/subunit